MSGQSPEATQMALFEGMDGLEGYVESIAYSDASPFTVARVRCGHRTISVVGEVEPPEIGKRYRFVGQTVQHPQYGEQFSTHWYEEMLPTTAHGIEKYLASGVIRGVGKGLAKRIVQHFGEDTLRVIEESPQRLAEVPRLKPEVRARLVEAMREHSAGRRVMLFLASFDITPGLSAKIYRAFGSACIDVVQKNPYRLADQVWGVGFKIADVIARKLGRALDDPFRLESGLLHALREAQDDGHLYLPQPELLKRAADLLECAPETLADPLEKTRAAGRIVVEDEAIYLQHLHRLEVHIAETLLGRNAVASGVAPTPDQIDAIERGLGISLAEQQKECLRRALGSASFIMTGGPGTGKTTTVRGILELCRARELKVALAAPTGRAARRMAEATGEEAKTLHRLLEYSPTDREFRRATDNPLKVDVLIVDETSMVDAWLFAALLDALPAHAHLVLVGDVDQLPSVGAGCVLRDLIESGSMPVVFLNEIFRQAEGSLIVQNAHRINRGEIPLKGSAEGDYFFIPADDPARLAEIVADLCATRLPGYYGVNPVEDVQVISPMYRGEAGVTSLNARLQQRLNPSRPGAPAAAVSNGQARVGDKVMQIRNNYERGVFNGDMGVVTAIDPEEGILHMRLLGTRDAAEDVEYARDETGELALAYACSVHKSQGSEFPAVVVPLTTQHYVMLQRNLLYTAITRARRIVVLVGSQRALAVAIKNDRVDRRYTRLAERLRSAPKEETPCPDRSSSATSPAT